MERLNKINDKTWDAITVFDSFYDMKRRIFYDLVFGYTSEDGKYSDTIDTPIGFTIDISIEPDDEDIYTMVEYGIHLTDKEGKDGKTLELHCVYGIGFWSGSEIDREIDNDIRKIITNIRTYEIVSDEKLGGKDNGLPF